MDKNNGINNGTKKNIFIDILSRTFFFLGHVLQTLYFKKIFFEQLYIFVTSADFWCYLQKSMMLILESILIFNTLLNDLMCTLLSFSTLTWFQNYNLKYCQQNQIDLNENSVFYADYAYDYPVIFSNYVYTCIQKKHPNFRNKQVYDDQLKI